MTRARRLGFDGGDVDRLVVAGMLFGLACGIVVLLKPFVGLLLYTAVFELRPAELYPALVPLRLEKVVGAMTLLALFLAQYRQTGRIVFDRSRQSKLLLLFVASVFMSVPNAYWRAGALEGFSTSISPRASIGSSARRAPAAMPISSDR